MEAWLKLVESEPIKIIQFDFGFTQYTDDTGVTVGNPTGGTINLVVAPLSEDTSLIDWMLSKKAFKNGKIDIDNQKKVIQFEKAECIQYHESFSHLGGEENTTISITISCETMTVGKSEPFKQKRKQK
jgi:hypothetical protein